MSMRKAKRRIVILFVSSLMLTACDPITLTLLGAGVSTGFSHGLSSVAYKTFTASIKRVNKATLVALKRMGIKVKSVKKTESGKVINAVSSDRTFEITLEAVSKKTTRIRSIAVHDNFFFDQATAIEIVNQTERALKRRRS